MLSNPHDHAAIVDIELSTDRGARTIDALHRAGPKSVRTIDLREHTVDDEVNVGVSIVATRGSLVVGRAQLYDQPERDGYSMVLGAPALRDQWWFAAGQQADDTTVEYTIYNPGDDDVTVNPVLLGFAPEPDFVAPTRSSWPAARSSVFTLGDVAGIPDGPVSAIFGTDGGDDRRRAHDHAGDQRRSVRRRSRSGATPASDGYVANTWYLGIGPARARPRRRCSSATSTPSTASSPSRRSPADGIVTVDVAGRRSPVPGSATIRIDLTDAASLGRAADRALDHADLRRAGPAPRAQRPGPRRQLAAPRRLNGRPPASSWIACSAPLARRRRTVGGHGVSHRSVARDRPEERATATTPRASADQHERDGLDP